MARLGIYFRVEFYKGSTRVASYLALKYKSRVEYFEGDKHASLLQYDIKKFQSKSRRYLVIASLVSYYVP
jgi:hypothetical protein